MRRDLSPRGIKKFVGRAELADALGISTKTLGRMVNNGSFPRPIKVSPNRVGWPVSVVQQYYEARLMAVSVDDPEKLRPDEIEDAAVELSARHMSNILGEPVSPDDVVIGAVKQLSPDDADTATNSQWLALWLAIEDRMSGLDEKQSLAVVYGLFPAMRPFLDKIANNAGKPLCPPGVHPLDLALCVLAGPGWEAFKAWAQAHNKRASPA
jgi:predicted DNA-binding transcriptional regulator AlpA